MSETPQGPELAQPRATSFSPEPATNPIRLLLVDDKVIVREGVRALLELEPGLHVVAQAASVSEAEALAPKVRPDVVITDAVLPDARGDEVVVRLQRGYAHAAIFVLVDRESARIAAPIPTRPEGGVQGYVLKTATAAEFLSGLRTVAQGVHYVHPALRSEIGSAAVWPVREHSAAPEPVSEEEQGDRAAFDALTEKEREVMDLLVLGHTNAEIAVISRVSLRTVEARRARVLQKLGVRTRADLVRVARRLS